MKDPDFDLASPECPEQILNDFNSLRRDRLTRDEVPGACIDARKSVRWKVVLVHGPDYRLAGKLRRTRLETANRRVVAQVKEVELHLTRDEFYVLFDLKGGIIMGVLYRSDGAIACPPDGGLSGTGDGRCADFFRERRNERIIWRDTRGGP